MYYLHDPSQGIGTDVSNSVVRELDANSVASVATSTAMFPTDTSVDDRFVQTYEPGVLTQIWLLPHE